MRTRLGTLAALALLSSSCSPAQKAGVRAAASVPVQEVLCGDANCTPLTNGAGCQWIADRLGLAGLFTDVRITRPLVGVTTVQSNGVDYSITLQEDGTTFDWSATGPVDLVVATAEVDSNVYPYAPPARGDSALTAWGENLLTQVLFCVQAPSATTGCTLTQGYWKTHSQQGPAPYDARWQNLGALEEQTPFFLSGQTWLEVFRSPVAGSAYHALAHQYMAAKLNALAGASAGALGDALHRAEVFFEAVAPATRLTAAQRAEVLALAALLDQFNGGTIGPGHCDAADGGGSPL